MIATWTARFPPLFRLAPDAPVPAKELAPRHPDAGFLLAEDDRIEEAAVSRLDADRAAAALLEIVEPHPDLDASWL